MSLVAREAITPTNKSPVFLIIAWVLQAAVILAVAAKVLLLHTSIGLHSDDWCILVAAALSIGQVVAVSFQGIYGIGKVQDSLTASQLITYQKAGYASEILYVATLAASKLSVAFFIYHITPFAPYRRIAFGIGLFIILWSLATIFGTAFQCHGPQKWAFVTGQCINLPAFWTAYGGINIATELALIAVPFEMFYTLISSLYKKSVLTFCFSLRLTVIAGIAVEIYFLHHPVYPSDSSYTRPGLYRNDFTFTSWPAFLTTQVIQCLSIITTCIPFMKSLFLGLETGMIQTGHVSTRNLSVSGRKGRSRPSQSNSISWMDNSRSSDGSNLFPGRADSLGGATVLPRRTLSFSDTTLVDWNNTRTPSRNTSVGGALGPTRSQSIAVNRATHSRREVSMIMEEDEDHHHRTRTHTPEPDIEMLAPDETAPDQHLLDIEIPSARVSWTSRFSLGSRMSLPSRNSLTNRSVPAGRSNPDSVNKTQLSSDASCSPSLSRTHNFSYPHGYSRSQDAQTLDQT